MAYSRFLNDVQGLFFSGRTGYEFDIPRIQAEIMAQWPVATGYSSANIELLRLRGTVFVYSGIAH